MPRSPCLRGKPRAGRKRALRVTLEEAMKSRESLYRSAVRVALGVGLVLSLPLVAMLITDDVVWSLADFVAAGVLLTTIGVALELAMRRAGNLAAALGIAALGIAAAALGEADDAPGLVLLGMLLILSSVCARGDDHPAQQVAPAAASPRRVSTVLSAPA
jgi:hypothetical protein